MGFCVLTALPGPRGKQTGLCEITVALGCPSGTALLPFGGQEPLCSSPGQRCTAQAEQRGRLCHALGTVLPTQNRLEVQNVSLHLHILLPLAPTLTRASGCSHSEWKMKTNSIYQC